MMVVIYYCPVCKLHHLDIVIEWHNAVPFHRGTDGQLHPVQKSGSHWLN